MPDINYRELFPNIFKTGSEGISRQLYYDETMKRVNVGVYVDPKEKLSDSQIKEKDEKNRNALSKAWGCCIISINFGILCSSFPSIKGISYSDRTTVQGEP